MKESCLFVCLFGCHSFFGGGVVVQVQTTGWFSTKYCMVLGLESYLEKAFFGLK